MKRSLLAAALLALLPAAWAEPSGYEVTGRIDVPGPTHWDEVRFDAPGQRLYIAQSPILTVLDTGTGKVVGTVPGAITAHDIAIDHDDGYGFVSAGRTESVIVFALDTLQKLATIKTGGDPHTMFFDSRSHRLLVIGDRTRQVGIVDPKRQKIMGKIDLDGPPQQMVVGRSGTVYVNVQNDNALVGINPRTVKQVSHRAFKQCKSPTGLVVDPKWRMFSTCRNGFLVVSSPDGRPEQELQIVDPRWSTGIDGAVWQDGHLFVSNGRNGTLLVVDETKPNHFEVVETIPTERGARTLAGDPEHHRLYSVSADIDPLATWDQPRAKPDSLHVLVIERP